MLSIADRLDDAFQSLPGNAYPIAIELSPDDAVAFQIWINVYARRASPLAKDFWRFGGIPVTCVDAWSSQVICYSLFCPLDIRAPEVDGFGEDDSFTRRSVRCVCGKSYLKMGGIYRKSSILF